MSDPGFNSGHSSELALSNDTPTAPPIHEMVVIDNYEQTTFNPTVTAPPSYAAAINETQPLPQRQIPQIQNISQEDVQNALDEFVSDHCCYGKNPIKKLEITEIRMSSAFHYKLDTFTESRETCWMFEPYAGAPYSTLSNGSAPGPWDIHVTPNGLFEKHEKTIEVPYTSYVKPCHICTGNGRIRCERCHGHGGSQCTWCHGHGRRKVFDDYEKCSPCDGTGRQRCMRCFGHGQIKCHGCKGLCQIRCFLQLTVFWENHSEDFISDQSGVPNDKIKKVTGHVAFDECYPLVYPLTDFPEHSIREASQNLIQKHSQAFPMQRIIQQRHSIKIVPVACVSYSLNQKIDNFHVYGLENKVYFPNYPSKCCCGCCTIM